MKEIRCPYCKSIDIDYSDERNDVIFDGEWQGSITRIGLRCKTPDCLGGIEGFNVHIGFRGLKNDVEYRDAMDDEL